MTNRPADVCVLHPPALSTSELQQFLEQGYLRLGRVAAPAEVESLCAIADRIMLGDLIYPDMTFQLCPSAGQPTADTFQAAAAAGGVAAGVAAAKALAYRKVQGFGARTHPPPTRMIWCWLMHKSDADCSTDFSRARPDLPTLHAKSALPGHLCQADHPCGRPSLSRWEGRCAAHCRSAPLLAVTAVRVRWTVGWWGGGQEWGGYGGYGDSIMLLLFVEVEKS